MRRGVLAKFKQNPHLKTQLIQTGECLLVEATPDEFWGIGRNGDGRNKLGAILMEVRAILNANRSGNEPLGFKMAEEPPRVADDFRANKVEDTVDQQIVPECKRCISYLSKQLFRGVAGGDQVIALLEETFEHLKIVSKEYCLRATTEPELLEGSREDSILRFLGSPEQKPSIGNQKKANMFFMWTLYRDDTPGVFGVSIISHSRKFAPVRIFHTTGYDELALCARRTKGGGLCIYFEGGPKLAPTRHLSVDLADGCAIFQARLRSLWGDHT